eukprot:g31798.t1
MFHLSPATKRNFVCPIVPYFSSGSLAIPNTNTMSGDRPGTKVFVGGLDASITKGDLEDLLKDAGKILSIWVARNPPGFAFVYFEDPRCADDAIKDFDQSTLRGSRISLEISHGKRGGGAPTDGEGCYECGKPGHYARDCIMRKNREYGRGRDRRRSRSRSRSRDRRGRRRSRSPRRSRSRSRSFPVRDIPRREDRERSRERRDSHEKRDSGRDRDRDGDKDRRDRRERSRERDEDRDKAGKRRSNSGDRDRAKGKEKSASQRRSKSKSRSKSPARGRSRSQSP